MRALRGTWPGPGAGRVAARGPQLARPFFQHFAPAPASKRHHERRLLQFPPELFYEVVSDVSKYSEFVPWCKRSVVLQKSDTKMSAELTVGFKMITESYLSQVTMQPPVFVAAESKQTNLFEFLRSEWRFAPGQVAGSTWVSFQVEFKFRSAIYNELSELFMSEVACNMMKAFEERCRVLATQRRAASATR